MHYNLLNWLGKRQVYVETNIQPRCRKGNLQYIQVTYSSRNSTPNMQHVVTLWVGVQVSRQFRHVKNISLLRKRLITMYVVDLVEENENRLHSWKILPPNLQVCVTTRIVWLKSHTLETPFTAFLYDHWDRALTFMERHLAFKCNCSQGESPKSTDKARGGTPSVDLNKN